MHSRREIFTCSVVGWKLVYMHGTMHRRPEAIHLLRRNVEMVASGCPKRSLAVGLRADRPVIPQAARERQEKNASGRASTNSLPDERMCRVGSRKASKEVMFIRSKLVNIEF
jgi:hypothetical protein